MCRINRRWIGIGLTGSAVVSILGANGLFYFQAPFSLWHILAFGLAALTAGVFFLLGAVVWWYSNHQRDAVLFFGFCSTMAGIFAAETSASAPTPGIFVFTTAFGSVVALLFLAFFFSDFPRIRPINRKVKSVYGWAVSICGGGTIALMTAYYSTGNQQIRAISFFWIILLIGCILGKLVYLLCYCRSHHLKQQVHQITWVFSGFLISFTMWIVTTLIPHMFNSSILPGQLSTLPTIVFPLTLSISILRHQLLVLTAYIRQTFLYLIRFLFLIMTLYFSWILKKLPLGGTFQLALLSLVCCLCCALFSWWVSGPFVDFLFFRDLREYRFIDQQLYTNLWNIKQVVSTLTLRIMQQLQIPREYMCCLILDQTESIFREVPAVFPGRSLPTLIQRRLGLLPTGLLEIECGHRVVTQLQASSRPVLLREFLQGERPSVLRRYLAATALGNGDQIVFVPLCAENRLIGIFLLGEQDGMSYAFSDFHPLQLLLERFVPALELARLVTHTNQQSLLFTTMSVNMSVANPTLDLIDSLEINAQRIAMTLSRTVSARVEFWFPSEHGRTLTCRIREGQAPNLITEPAITSWFEQDTHPHFVDHACVQPALFPSPIDRARVQGSFAWLPLHSLSEGVLLISYSRFRPFQEEEKQVLCSFADQCAQQFLLIHIQQELQLIRAQLTDQDETQVSLLKEEVSHLLKPLYQMKEALTQLEASRAKSDVTKQVELVQQAQQESQQFRDQLSSLIHLPIFDEAKEAK